MEKKPRKVNAPVKDLLFRKFKKAYGLKVFLLKYDTEREKGIYSRVLTALKDRNYLNFVVNSQNIQIFLSDRGRTLIDEQTGWEIDEPSIEPYKKSSKKPSKRK